MSRRAFRIRSDTWRPDAQPEQPGVRIGAGRGFIFLPLTQLRPLADALHDYMDDHESETTE